MLWATVLSFILLPITLGVLSGFNYFGTYPDQKRISLEGNLTEAQSIVNFWGITNNGRQAFLVMLEKKNADGELMRFGYVAFLNESPEKHLGKRVRFEYAYATPEVMLILSDPDPMGGYPQIYLRGDEIYSNHGPVVYGQVSPQNRSQ
ncbi:MAG: hypothetical protein Q7S12_03765 [bacterium]|nr:hypothetical protein [bacterium]